MATSVSSSDSSSISTTSSSSISTTKNGTKILKTGSELDKNAFLKILSAELSNQDPSNPQDSTQYISQLAQFSGLEQMSNLNSTMTGYAANSLIGKGVVLTVNDGNGIPYTGIVKDVTNSYGTIKLGVEIKKSDNTTETMEFTYSEVKSVIEAPDNNLKYINANTALYTAASLIGKRAEFSTKDSEGNNLVGLIKGTITDNGTVKLRVLTDGSTALTTLGLDTLLNLSDE